MSNAIYKKDLHDVALAVAQGSKDYTNKEVKKAKNELLTLISKNTVETEDHTNELTYRITAPSGAKLLQLQAIGGNSVKYAPSVASDDSVAKDKVIPEYTYDAQLNYIGGASKVMVNDFDSNLTSISPETNVSYTKVGNSYVIVNSNNAQSRVVFNTTLNGNHTIAFDSDTAISYGFRINSLSLQNNIVVGKNIFEDIAFTGNNPISIYVPANSTVIISNIVSTTNYFENIRSAKTTSVKFEGANKADLQDVAQTTTTGVTYKCENGAVTMGANATNNTRVFIPLKTPLPAGTYSYNQFTKLNGHNAYLSDDNNATNIQLLLSSGTTNPTATITTTRTMNYLYYYTPNGSQYNSYTFTPMIVRGSTAPTEFKPYIAPITKAIPSEILNDVRYGLGFSDTQFNKLDLITKHLTGEWNIVDLGTLTYSLEVRSGRNIFIATIPTLKEQVDTNIAINASCPLYRAVPNTATWVDKDMAYSQSIGSQKIAFVNNDYDTVASFTTAMSGVYLLYQTATQFDVDFSQYIDDDFKKFALDNNYTNAELINEYNYDIPNKLEYYGTIKETLCPSITITRNGVDILTRNLPTITSDGYGVNADAHNLRVFSDYEGNAVNKRYTNVDKQTDLNTLSWSEFGTAFVQSTNLVSVIKKPSSNSVVANALSIRYNMVARNSADNTNDICVNSDGYVVVRNREETPNGVFYYEKATTDETDIDDFDFFFDVEEGDVITFNNPYAQQVYATYSFIIKEAKSNE